MSTNEMDPTPRLGVMRMSDPGGSGWPDPPKVSQSEVSLYGDLAEVVRLMGTATVAASDAYALACKTEQDADSLLTTSEAAEESRAFFNQVIATLYALQQHVGEVQLLIAEQAIVRRREDRDRFASAGQKPSANPDGWTFEPMTEAALADRMAMVKAASGPGSTYIEVADQRGMLVAARIQGTQEGIVVRSDLGLATGAWRVRVEPAM